MTGLILAKTMSTFVFVYTLYFLSFVENRVSVTETFLKLSNAKRVPLMIFLIIALSIFTGNF